MTTVVLRAGNVQPVWAGHPWVFAQAIERVDGAPQAGDDVTVIDPKGTFLGRGLWSPESAIRVRIYTRDPGETLDARWLRQRFIAAQKARKTWCNLPRTDTDGYRLVHAEADRIPGLIVDMYGRDVACVQFLTRGMKDRQDLILGELMQVTGAKTVLEFANERVQKIEGFHVEPGVIRGPSPDALVFRERGFDYMLPLVETHQKTGYYFDQRENRDVLEKHSRDKTVLDAFSYVGAFSLAAMRGGAKHVVAIDSSASAVAVGAVHAQHHGYGEQLEWICADVRQELKKRVDKKERFDVVIVDPPKLIPSKKHFDRGRRAYRDINALALRLLGTDGLLLSCSCSAAMEPQDFLRMLALAARDAHREIAILRMGTQAPDHPTLPGFPEGNYLKAAFVRVL